MRCSAGDCVSADVVCDVASAWHSERPPYHYAELIELALTDKSLLTVRQIYSWIKYGT